MRVVERKVETSSVLYRVTRGIGVAAAILSLLVCILIIANNLRVKSLDPIHLPALERLIKELEKNPEDQALREEIQELDLLARKAFFSSQQFNNTGIWLILISLSVMLIAFKTLSKIHQEVPYPEGRDPSDAMIKEAGWRRWAVGGTGLVLVGFALFLALTTRSELDMKMAVVDAPATEPVPTAEAEPAAASFPSREELFKNWPGFRGVDGNGLAPDAQAPLEWDGKEGTNIVWKVAVPKPGFGSPVIWGDRVFLSGGDDSAREVYCFNRANGEMLWRKEVKLADSPAEPPSVAADTGHAAASPATNGSLFFAIFSTGDLVAYDFEGNLAWGRNLGVPKNHYGHSSSLILFENLLLVEFDHAESGRFLGLDAATGKTVWETTRDMGLTWSSPLVVNTGNRMEAILSANPLVVSYDPKTGKELWRLECLGGEVAPSPAFGDGLVYVASDYVKLAAIDVNTAKITWDHDGDIPGVSSPLVVNGLIFYGLSDGGMLCRDAKTGEELWFEDTDYGFYASPVLVGDRIYLMDREGTMHIFTASREFKSLGKPVLGEEAVCTPAFIDGHIYYRGIENLYRIGT